MRIAIYVHDMRASGVVRAMIGLARFLAERGDDAILVAGSSDGPLGAGDVAPVRFAAASESPRSQARVVPALRRTLLGVAPDVVLSGGNHGHVSAWAATRGTGVPLVLTFSNPMTRPGQGRRNAWRRAKSAVLLRAAARSIVVGANVAADPAFAAAVARGRAVLVPNGIDVAAARARALGPAPFAVDGVPVVLAVGRLHRQKNFEGLIDAVAVASRTRPLRLVILGGGPEAYRADLAARAARHGIADRVTFAGVTDNVFPWLRAARVFALPSHYEGGPSLALLEALAVGTPVVANATGSDAPAVLDHGRCGRLADARDPAAFAAALIAQIDDPVRPGDRADAYDSAAMFAAYRALLATVARRTPANAPQPVSSSATTLPPSVAQAPPITP